MDKNVFKERFRYYLRRSGYNQKEVAHQLNVDASTLSKWVNGDNPWPMDALTQVCELLELEQQQEQELFVTSGLDQSLALLVPSGDLSASQVSHLRHQVLPSLSFSLSERDINELHDLLKTLEKNTDNPARQAKLRDQLKKLLDQNESLANQLHHLLETTSSTDTSTVFNVSDGGTAFVGDNNVMVKEKGIYVKGDVQGSINLGSDRA